MSIIKAERMVSGNRLRPDSIRTIQVADLLVDDDLFDELNKFRWTLDAKGCPCRSQGNRHVYLSQEVWQLRGQSPRKQLDHADRNPLNGQFYNLRPANHSQNQANTGVQENSTSGLKGVNLYKRTGKYRATIKVQRVPIHLGYFATAQEAAIAYDLAAAAYFGPYAATNKSLGLIFY